MFASALLSAIVLASSAEPRGEDLRPWTLLVYGAADNNADGPILRFLDSVRKAIDDDPGIDVLLFLDRHDAYSHDAVSLGEDFTGARLYRLRKDSAERLAGGDLFPEIGLTADVELDSADAKYLKQFIAWGKATSPARRYGLMIYSHASGQSMCPDEDSAHDMGIPEVSRTLTGAESLDFLALELCNMAGIEAAYEWRPRGGAGFGADVLVAIPNAGPPLDWDRAFLRMRSPGHATTAKGAVIDPAAMTAEDFGKLVIEEGRIGRETAGGGDGGGAHESAGCFDLREAANVKAAVDSLAVALAEAEEKGAFMKLRVPGKGCAMTYDEGGPFVDLFDVAQRTAVSDAFEDATREAAKQVMETVDRFVVASFGMSGYPGFEAGRNGVFIVLPAVGFGSWGRFRWYSPDAFEEGGKDIGRWSFLSDGATRGNEKVENWFELLDSWLDESELDGGANRYGV